MKVFTVLFQDGEQINFDDYSSHEINGPFLEIWFDLEEESEEPHMYAFPINTIRSYCIADCAVEK